MNTLITLPCDELNENEFKLGKLTYIAKPVDPRMEDTCELCSFKWNPRKCLNSPPCDALDRKDERDIYYTERIECAF